MERINRQSFTNFNKPATDTTIDTDKKNEPLTPLCKSIEQNITAVQRALDQPQDLKVRIFTWKKTTVSCAVLYIDGIVNKQDIQLNILDNLQRATKLPNEPELLFSTIWMQQIAMNQVEKVAKMEDVILALLSGESILFIAGVDQALTINTIGGEQRQIQEPLTETLIKGPRSGFVETIQTNIALVRREMKDPNLRFKHYSRGKRSKKKIVLTYVQDIVNPKLVEEVNRRLETIDTDMIHGSGYIEEWIEDSFLSPFPQTLNTERPDKVAAAVAQGKIAILVEGTPFALIAPANISNILHSPEDYYERWIVGSLLRLLRYFGTIISVFLPALYIALISIQPGMIPTDLLISIAATREGVPFPPVIEALLMVVTLELLQEAGARLPQTIGQTIGIVGGLVIGEAAVQAGIVSPIMVIIIALTAIANFAIPSYSVAITFRIVRFGFMFAAAVFGLYGVVLVFIAVMTHMANLKSFGVPYLTPFAPFMKSDMKDTILRSPQQVLHNRPAYLKDKGEASEE